MGSLTFDVCVGGGGQGCPSGREKGGLVPPTETNVHGDALCLMVKTGAGHKTTAVLLNNGWRLMAVGGWRFVAVSGGRGRRLAVGGPSGLSFGLEGLSLT